MTNALAYTAHIEIVNCYKCGAPIALANKANLVANKGDFYCPNGHCQAFIGTEITRLEEQLKKETKRREMAEREVAMEKELREKADHARTKIEKAHARDRHRTANGVCMCCNRTFSNLARHMKTKHPEQG